MHTPVMHRRLILNRKPGNQHQPADIVQQPGHERRLRIDISPFGKQPGTHSGCNRMPPKSLETEPLQLCRRKALNDGRCRDQSTKAVQTENG